MHQLRYELTVNGDVVFETKSWTQAVQYKTDHPKCTMRTIYEAVPKQKVKSKFNFGRRFRDGTIYA